MLRKAWVGASVFLGILCTLSTFSPAADYAVSLLGSTFSPANLTISQGDKVTWTNNSAGFHTSTSGTPCKADGTWNSPGMPPGATFSFTFSADGAFKYFCIPHCFSGMIGTIFVNAATGIGDVDLPNYKLHQNVPNPFSPETTIDYDIRTTARVEIQIFNVRGQLIRTIEDEARTPGGYSAVWDGKDVNGTSQATGVYFYQMKIDDVGVEMKKMVLLR